ncbi:MAG: inositol-3-phosphate synthase [Desulfobulbaceae bacterium]|nr:inositol-3-phosphate synthase [Desulfobulbaceae bacterium]
MHNNVGVWLIGALGSISVTVLTGALALRRGAITSTGMVTEMEPFSDLDLLPMDRMVFGGCDIRQGSLLPAVRDLCRGLNTVSASLLQEIEEDVKSVEPHISPGTQSNCGPEIEQLGRRTQNRLSPADEVEVIRGCIRAFRQDNNLDQVVVINLASTEPMLKITDSHLNLRAFKAMMETGDETAVRASTLYTYAALLEDCAYINFTPSNGALIPALIELAESRGLPVMGNDGKTGETLVKSALAPMFKARNLDVLSWEGFNILGNMDGQVLSNATNREAKIKSKDQVLPKILGYEPHSRVHINYVPSLGDQKTAWDFIHFQGFMGAKMSLQFVWQGYDSMLAAPLILDMTRLAVLARKRGEIGLMPQLACFFKNPIGVEEHSLSCQQKMLLEYAKKAIK